jgi:hypothetical protein
MIRQSQRIHQKRHITPVNPLAQVGLGAAQVFTGALKWGIAIITFGDQSG